MLPNLSNLRIGGCLPPSLRKPKSKRDGAELRGKSAVFWPVDNDSMEVRALDSEFYPDAADAGVRTYQDDVERATDARKRVNRDVEPTLVPPLKENIFLYHWTSLLPSGMFLEKGRQLETKGFIWTSTYDGFAWNGTARATIVLPKGASPEIYVDPVPHSRRHPCKGEVEGAPLAHHQDVILPPSVFVVDDAEGSKDNVRTAAWGLLHRVLIPFVESGIKVASTSPDEEVWVVTVEEEYDRDSVMEVLTDPAFQYKMLNKSLRMFIGAVEKSQTDELSVLIYPDRMRFKFPVLRWVGKADPHPLFIVDAENGFV